MYNTKENYTSQKILDAAYKCISTKGYANVTLRDIAEEAGVALSQLNYYYKNKEGLFIEVIQKVKQMSMDILEEFLQQSVTTKEKLSVVVRFSQGLIREETDIYKVVLDLFNMGMWSQTFTKPCRSFFEEITAIIEKYIASDYFLNEKLQGYSPNVITRIVIGAVFGMAIQYILDPENQELLDSLDILKIMTEL